MPEVKGYQPFFGNAQTSGTSYVGSTSYQLKKTINFGRAVPVYEIKNELQNNYGASNYGRGTYCKIRFYYFDGTNAESSEEYEYNTTPQIHSYLNPNYAKLVTKVEVYLKYSHTNNGYGATPASTVTHPTPMSGTDAQHSLTFG